jgi:uncharacterized damage-inducible protein DinB
MVNPHALAGQVEWAAKNIAYNLDFIPADKLNYKPSPTANSALEVVSHVIGALNFFLPVVQGGAPGQPGDLAKPSFTTAEEAKQQLVEAATNYAAAVRNLNPDDLAKKVQLHFGAMPLGFVASMAATDLVHHHGQIAYIHTILGDTESHFDFSLLPQD